MTTFLVTINPCFGDLSDKTTVANAVDGVDAVIHTATPGGSIPGMSFEEVVSSAVATLELLRSLTLEHQIPLISTSGISIYGDTGKKLADEKSPTQVPPFLQPLVDMENQLIDAPHTRILRTSIVYGRAGGAGILSAIKGLKSRGRAAIVYENVMLSFVHVEDLADLYLLLLQQLDAPSLLIAVSQIVSVKDFMAAAASVVGIEENFDLISPEEARSSFGDLGLYLARNMRVSASLAQETLKWHPSRMPLVEELRTGSYRYATI